MALKFGLGFPFAPVLRDEYDGDGNDLGGDADDLPPPDDDGGDEPPIQSDEPFLKVSDSTVYKDRDSALRGIQEKDRLIEQYKRYGKPEELAALRERATLVDRLQGALGGNGQQKDSDPLAKLDPETRSKWEPFLGTLNPILSDKFVSREGLQEELKKMGFMRREEFEAEQRQREGMTLAETRLRERGVEPTPRKLRALEAVIDDMASDPGVQQRFQQMWASGQRDAVIDEALDELGYPKREAKPSGSDEADKPGRERDENGRYKRVEQDRRKRSTERLPKAPPQGGGTAAEGEDSKPKRMSAKERIAASNAMIQDAEKRRQRA